MAYTNFRLDVYRSLTSTMPSVAFSIMTDEIIDLTITPHSAAADDVFEVYGRFATITLLRTGNTAQWLLNKNPSSAHPEYIDAAIQIRDLDTGRNEFSGALRMDRITHIEDSAYLQIVLSDAMDIWITEAKKTEHTFTGAIGGNLCSFDGLTDDVMIALKIMADLDPDEERDFNPLMVKRDLMDKPVSDFSIGMNQSSVPSLPTEYIQVTHQRINLEEYDNDFSKWIAQSSGQKVTWQQYFSYVGYDFTTKVCYLGMVHVWRVGNSASDYRYSYKQKVWKFTVYNLLQPYHFVNVEVPPAMTLNQVWNALVLVFGSLPDGSANLYRDNNKLALHTPMPQAFEHTINGYVYGLRMSALDNNGRWNTDLIDVTLPINFNTIAFREGSHDCASIANAMFIANILHLSCDHNGIKQVRAGVLNPKNDFSAGYRVPDEDIIGQQRSGLFGDLNRIASALRIVKNSDALISIINNLFREQLAKISCRISFSLPDEYYENSAIRIHKNIKLDSSERAYIITSVSYPNNGLIDIECVGEWN